MTQHRIRLDDLLGRDVGVQWFEGVALVLAICRERQGGPHAGFPEARDVFVRADGSVEVLASGADKPAAAAGHLLAQMLSDDAPVRLRLVVTQATASGGGGASLEELSEALAYFERPDAPGTLRRLYERASHAPATPAASPRLASPHPGDAPPESSKSPSGARKSRLRVYEAEQPTQQPKGVSRLALVGVTVAAVLCASAWSISMVVNRSGNGGSDTAGRSTAAAASSDDDEPLEKGTSRNGKARPSETPGARAAGQHGTGAAPTRSSRANALSAAEEVPDGAPPSLPKPISFVPTAPAGTDAAAAAPRPIVVVASGPNAGDPAGRLYSAADSGVKVPRHVYPKLPEDPPAPVTDPGGRTILDLVIATDGLVERVKLRTPPRDVHEFMLVSAAKAWRFEPATVGGRPVRFLYSMPIMRD